MHTEFWYSIIEDLYICEELISAQEATIINNIDPFIKCNAMIRVHVYPSEGSNPCLFRNLILGIYGNGNKNPLIHGCSKGNMDVD